jgi:hypothetical protein
MLIIVILQLKYRQTDGIKKARPNYLLPTGNILAGKDKYK